MNPISPVAGWLRGIFLRLGEGKRIGVFGEMCTICRSLSGMGVISWALCGKLKEYGRGWDFCTNNNKISWIRKINSRYVQKYIQRQRRNWIQTMVMKKPVYVKQSQKYMTVRTTSVHKIPGIFALQIEGKKEEVVRRGVICVAKHVEYEIKCGDLRKKIGEICSHSLRGLCGLK